ncbi:hypothetical protein LCGC14_2973650 [marine sediment metagenome]|uniref:Uncharacterized protein n=1 Tax=marine sediment metagenome TaxID=412755 RepID=A0A0F8X9K8_9ZZZZ
MIIIQKQKEWIERVLTSLHFVKWDRFLDINFDKQRALNFYGWIEHSCGTEDTYKDFVCIEFNLFSNKVYFVATSSSEKSKEICEILDDKHNDCHRVEHDFQISNVVKLK